MERYFYPFNHNSFSKLPVGLHKPKLGLDGCFHVRGNSLTNLFGTGRVIPDIERFKR